MNKSFLLAAGGALGAVALSLWTLSSGTRRKKSLAPPPPLATFGWGPVLCRVTNCVRFCSSPVQTVREAHLACGTDVFTIPVLWMRLTFFVGRKAQAYLSKKNDKEASTFDAYRDWTIPLFGENVVYDNQKQFVEQRDMIKSIVHAGLRSFTPKIEEEYDLFMENKGWLNAGTKGVEVDIMDFMSEVVLQSAGRCLLGRGTGSDQMQTLELQKLVSLYHKLDEGLSALTFIMPKQIAHLFPSVRKQVKARVALEEFFQGVAEKRRQARIEGNATCEEFGFLEKILTQTYKNGNKLQDWEVARLMIAAMFAGQHTSAIAGAYAALHIVDTGNAHNGELYAELMAEQRGDESSLEATNTEPTEKEAPPGVSRTMDGFVSLCKESVDQMYLLGGVVLESIRMHPPLIMVMRKAMTSLTYTEGGVTVPAGDMCCMSVSVAGMLPETWGEDGADRDFDPKRFAQGNRHETNGEFLGFGHGLHKCPGKPFALLDLKVLLSRILRDFKMEQVDPLPREDYTQLVVGPLKPCRVRLVPRRALVAAKGG